MIAIVRRIRRRRTAAADANLAVEKAPLILQPTDERATPSTVVAAGPRACNAVTEAA